MENNMYKGRIIRYELLKDILEKIFVEEHKVFLMTCYASLARVGEIVRGRYRHNPPISSSHLETETTSTGSRILYINLLTEKTYKPRSVPVNRDLEPWLTEPILKYADKKNGFLWNYSTRWAEKIYKKYIGKNYSPEKPENIHLLRHWRLSHHKNPMIRITKKNLPNEALRRMGGWSDTRTMERVYDGTMIFDHEGFF